MQKAIRNSLSILLAIWQLWKLWKYHKKPCNLTKWKDKFVKSEYNKSEFIMLWMKIHQLLQELTVFGMLPLDLGNLLWNVGRRQIGLAKKLIVGEGKSVSWFKKTWQPEGQTDSQHLLTCRQACSCSEFPPVWSLAWQCALSVSEEIPSRKPPDTNRISWFNSYLLHKQRDCNKRGCHKNLTDVHVVG